MTSEKQTRQRLLSTTRPGNAKPKPSLSSQTTRKLVRTHHTLRKQFTSAVARGDDSKADAIKTEIEASGGLKRYQEASIQGQSAQRGGDTSKVLMEWLSELGVTGNTRSGRERNLKMLEVGSLRVDNACSRSGIFEMKRIDLHSQHPDIKEQDFMTMPLPTMEDFIHEGFDIVSLSLVVNFVGNAAQRGEMLKRVGDFLRPVNDKNGNDMREHFPALFLVLPAPCVSNSRYLNESRLKDIMEGLGYKTVKRKLSPKLIYFLWRYQKPLKDKARAFEKEEMRQGRSRNNFAIVLH